jgi:hypothetical protein
LDRGAEPKQSFPAPRDCPAGNGFGYDRPQATWLGFGDRGARPFRVGRGWRPVYNAGDGLGRLLRTLYLCDYLSNSAFRLEVLDLLNQGEAVHSLQRAIHNRMITAKHGRTMEELGTISSALTLLANIVMAWNTHRLEAMIDQTPRDYSDAVVSRLAPVGHKHINMRGILTFDLSGYRSSLLRQASVSYDINRLASERRHKLLKLRAFQIGTFGTKVTTTPKRQPLCGFGCLSFNSSSASAPQPEIEALTTPPVGGRRC